MPNDKPEHVLDEDAPPATLDGPDEPTEGTDDGTFGGDDQ